MSKKLIGLFQVLLVEQEINLASFISSMGRFLRPLIDEMYRANSQTAASTLNPSRTYVDQSDSQASSASEDNLNNSASSSLLASILAEFFQHSDDRLSTGQLSAKREETRKCREIDFISPTCHSVENASVFIHFRNCCIILFKSSLYHYLNSNR